jgi:hypothetical protein
MLEDDSSPIIPDPASADRLCEWHANPGAQDKYGIAERQGAGVSREHGCKSQIKRCTMCFDASNVRADRPQEDRNPKEREKPLFGFGRCDGQSGWGTYAVNNDEGVP